MRTHSRILWLLVLLAMLVLVSRIATAAPDGYDLTWNTLNISSQAVSSGGDYGLSGSIGQPDAGPDLTGGGYSLTGGFWNGVGGFNLHLPLVIRQ